MSRIVIDNIIKDVCPVCGGVVVLRKGVIDVPKDCKIVDVVFDCVCGLSVKKSFDLDKLPKGLRLEK